VRLALTADMATEFAVAGWKEGVLAASVNLVAGTNYYLHMLTHMTGDPKIGYGPNLGFSARSPINGHYSTLYIAAQATSPASFNPATATQSGGSPRRAGSSSAKLRARRQSLPFAPRAPITRRCFARVVAT